MAYEILKELEIPGEAQLQPIPGEILELYGFSPDISPYDLRLAQLAIRGTKISESWCIGAFDVASTVSPPGLESAYGAIALNDGSVNPEEVLLIAEAWIKDSEDIAWVPGPIKETHTTPQEVSGVILATGGNRHLRQTSMAEREGPTDDQERKTTRWASRVFVQGKKKTGTRRYRETSPIMPVFTPTGIARVSTGLDRDYYTDEMENIGPSPLDQLAAFLNKHGDAIKDWKIIGGTYYSTNVAILYQIEEVKLKPENETEHLARLRAVLVAQLREVLEARLSTEEPKTDTE